MSSAALIFAALLFFATAPTTIAADGERFVDCATQMSTLEDALYETGDNIFQLNRVFYPPSMRTSRFIRIVYTFLNELGEDDGCNVTYIWAIGGFLFFQPPTVFKFNTLFFHYPNNNLTHVDLTLPNHCRPLIQANESATMCSCVRDSERLEILTQQLNVYASFPNRDQITRENTFARAVCSENLEDIYYSGDNPSFTFIIVCSTLVFPLITLIVLLSVVRKMDDSIINSFTQSTSHGTVVAIVLTGSVISIGILACNILSCVIVVRGNHEYSNDVKETSINLYIAFGTLIFNILFILPPLFCIFYITVCFNGRRLFKRVCCDMKCSANPCVARTISLLVGKNVFNKMDKLSKNSAISFMFPFMIATPILCFSSHIGYILLAWITEPSKATAAFLHYYAIIVYLFFTFRKCYNFQSRMKFSLSLSKRSDNKPNTCTKESGGSIELDAIAEKLPSTVEQASEEPSIKSRYVFSFSRSNEEHINTQAFCLLLLYAFPITGLAVMITLIFRLLPFSSEELVIYIFHLLQLVVVLVSTQFAYQLLFGNSFSLESIVQKFKEVYAKRGGDENLAAIARKKHEELCDVAGEFAAEFTDVIIQKTTVPTRE